MIRTRRFRRQSTRINLRRLVNGAIRIFQSVDSFVNRTLSGRAIRTAEEEVALQNRGVYIMAGCILAVVIIQLIANRHVYFPSLNR